MLRMFCLVVFFVALPAFGQGMGAPVRIDSWKSAHNQKRLRLDWEALPAYKAKKLPDGTEQPPEAPWPFLLYIQQIDSKADKKLQDWVFSDTRFILALRAIKAIKVRPAKAIDLPYLASARGIKDPCLVLVNRKFEVVTVLNSERDFKANKVLRPMAKLVKEEYKIKLPEFVGPYLKLLKDAEKLWQEERAIEKLATKAGSTDKAKAAKLDKEVTEREQALAEERAKLVERELAIQDSLQLQSDEPEALPTSVGSGRSKRKLTPEELEAIQTFREFARDDNPIVRAAALEDLGAIDSAAMVAVILDASNDMDPRVVEAAGVALGKMKSAESLEAMAAALGGGKAKARQAALLGFASTEKPFPPALPRIQGFITSGSDDMRRSAIRAAENQRDAAAAPALIKALADRLPALRVMAANALGELKAAKAAAPLAEQLTASDWSLQKAAAEALGKIRVKESIAPLLERFEQEEGLLKEVLHKTLVAITGQDFKYRPERWRRWWDRWGHSFKVPTEAEIEEAKRKAAEALKGYAQPDKRKYHQIETLSKKMIFVVDISASMNDKIILPHDAPPKVLEEFPSRVKMEIAKKELIELLATLDSSVYFDIITFAGRAKAWKGNLVSGSSRTSAIKYVAKLKAKQAARGGRKASSGDDQKTNTYEALMTAFGLADEKVPDWKARTKVDTIFFVTDGLPTTGEIVEVPKLVHEITQLNRSRGVVIHLITFDKLSAARLGKLALQNGGQVVLRGFGH